MAYCPADCAATTLTPNEVGNCDLKVRKRSIDRIGFFPCSTDLPSPFTCAGLEALVNANELTFSSPLANIELGDPEFEELTIADCRPAQRMVVGRTITFQDRIAIEKDTNSPATTNKFFDYDFWKDKKQKKATMRYMFVYCDGSIVVPKDENGEPLSATFDVFLSYERQGTGGNSYILEIKKAQLQFKGDPLDLEYTRPEETNDNEIFSISDCGLL